MKVNKKVYGSFRKMKDLGLDNGYIMEILRDTYGHESLINPKHLDLEGQLRYFHSRKEPTRILYGSDPSDAVEDNMEVSLKFVKNALESAIGRV